MAKRELPIERAMDTVRGGMPEQGSFTHEDSILAADRQIAVGFRGAAPRRFPDMTATRHAGRSR
jgi:hypothetical protein